MPACAASATIVNTMPTATIRQIPIRKAISSMMYEAGESCKGLAVEVNVGEWLSLVRTKMCGLREAGFAKIRVRLIFAVISGTLYSVTCLHYPANTQRIFQ